MRGIHLRIYTYEDRRHAGLPVYEWLLEQAKATGIAGGSAFRAMAGFGRHGRLHEQAFFELAGEQPVVVEFIATEAEAENLMLMLGAELPGIFVARSAIEYGAVGEGGGPPGKR